MLLLDPLFRLEVEQTQPAGAFIERCEIFGIRIECRYVLATLKKLTSASTASICLLILVSNQAKYMSIYCLYFTHKEYALV